MAKNFAEADADGDGFVNEEEAVRYGELQRAWRTERYGGVEREQTAEEKQKWKEALAAAGLVPEGQPGFSLDNFKRVIVIFGAIMMES